MLMLLLGWLSAPAALASRGSDACSAACCVDAGHCCCTPRHASVAGQPPGDYDEVVQAEVSGRCPDGCAAPQLSLRAFARAAAYHLDLSNAAFDASPQAVRAPEPAEVSFSPQRAPPSFHTAVMA
jgi:hypothetical protein